MAKHEISFMTCAAWMILRKHGDKRNFRRNSSGSSSDDLGKQIPRSVYCRDVTDIVVSKVKVPNIVNACT